MSALAALIAWPFVGSASHVSAAQPTPAAVLPDYIYRDKTIAFYERRVQHDSRDQISARMLAQQYMQRYRESGDIDDIKRSLKQARRSLLLQPGNNWGAYEILASAETALHLFHRALRDEEGAASDRPDDSNAQAQIASLEMELGRYDVARHVLGRLRTHFPNDPGVNAVAARYAELTGNLAGARALLNRGQVQMDEVIDNPAQARAWFHYRAGEMAFAGGDTETAERDEREALAIFPNFAAAGNSLARFCWAAKDWDCALRAATKAADMVPLPETLGYKADAQRALGDASGAAQTQDLIFTIERIGNSYHVSDRLLAVYYSEHGLRLDDALNIARREVQVRGQEIYAQDTLAWSAAMDGHWSEARGAVRLAMRYGTQDPRLLYHAGIIALHFGDRAGAEENLSKALALNPQFHPIYADEARSLLQTL